MTLKYLEEKDAEQICAGTLQGWIKDSGYKGCFSAGETKEAVEEAKRWASKSQTALALMRFVETAPEEILVVGMRGGYQCFDSTGTDQIKKVPVVYIDLAGELTRFVRQPHQLHFAPEDCKGKGVPMVKMDNRIALLHEFGHAKQWMERPLLFDNHFMTGTGKAATPAITVRKKIDDGDPLMNPGGKYGNVKQSVKGTGKIGDTFAQAIQSRAAQILGPRGTQIQDPLMNPDGGHVLTSEELDEIKAITGYGVRIESDNMARHEWPICDEMGIPRRMNYRDISGTSTATASQTSMLLKRAGETQAKKDAPVVNAIAMVICPRCNIEVPRNQLESSCNPFHRPKSSMKKGDFGKKPAQPKLQMPSLGMPPLPAKPPN